MVVVVGENVVRRVKGIGECLGKNVQGGFPTLVMPIPGVGIKQVKWER